MHVNSLVRKLFQIRYGKLKKYSQGKKTVERSNTWERNEKYLKIEQSTVPIPMSHCSKNAFFSICDQILTFTEQILNGTFHFLRSVSARNLNWNEDMLSNLGFQLPRDELATTKHMAMPVIINC